MSFSKPSIMLPAEGRKGLLTPSGIIECIKWYPYTNFSGAAYKYRFTEKVEPRAFGLVEIGFYRQRTCISALTAYIGRAYFITSLESSFASQNRRGAPCIVLVGKPFRLGVIHKQLTIIHAGEVGWLICIRVDDIIRLCDGISKDPILVRRNGIKKGWGELPVRICQYCINCKYCED